LWWWWCDGVGGASLVSSAGDDGVRVCVDGGCNGPSTSC
jgi:hypothetical protein